MTYLVDKLSEAASNVAQYIHTNDFTDVVTSGKSGFISYGLIIPHLPEGISIHSFGDKENQTLYRKSFDSKQQQIEEIRSLFESEGIDSNRSSVLYLDDHLRGCYKLTQVIENASYSEIQMNTAVLVKPKHRDTTLDRGEPLNSPRIDDTFYETFAGSTDSELLEAMDIFACEINSGTGSGGIPPEEYAEFLHHLQQIEKEVTGFSTIVSPLLFRFYGCES